MKLFHTGSIAAALIIAFIVFIVVRGELPVYMGIVGIGPASAQCGGTPASGSAATTTAGTIIADLPPIPAPSEPQPV